MNKRIDNFIIREADGSARFANTLVLSPGLRVVDTLGGLPELTGIEGEVSITPSGGDDSGQIQRALDTSGVGRVRLAPGQFQLLSGLTLHPGQVLSGSGADLTTLNANLVITVTLGSSDSAVESLSIVGSGTAVTGSGTNLRVDGVRIQYADVAVQLSGTRLSVSRSRVENSGGEGLWFTGGEQVSVSDVAIDDVAGAGLRFEQLDNVRVTGATLRNCDVGIFLHQGSAHSFTAVRISTSNAAVMLNTTGFSITNASQVSLDACSHLYGRGTALNLNNCRNVTVGTLYADLSLSTGSAPHVVVGGGSTLVFFASVQRVGTPPGAPFELDVAGAGGRVLFAQQDFTPAKINSGGKYVAL
ncbi:MAG: right-handed parallel beta-helix repeat-containing protein [Gemmatimonadetes bacterium]|nr:right-handed parallel beta-helix repeat-containing protein [Gemmatimonadota bacterium]